MGKGMVCIKVCYVCMSRGSWLVCCIDCFQIVGTRRKGCLLVCESCVQGAGSVVENI